MQIGYERRASAPNASWTHLDVVEQRQEEALVGGMVALHSHLGSRRRERMVPRLRHHTQGPRVPGRSAVLLASWHMVNQLVVAMEVRRRIQAPCNGINLVSLTPCKDNPDQGSEAPVPTLEPHLFVCIQRHLQHLVRLQRGAQPVTLCKSTAV